MASIIRFVDTIASSPTTLLNLNSAPLMVSVDGIDLSPPDLRRTEIQTSLGKDGDLITDSVPENRMLKIPVTVVQTATAELAAAAITNLHTQLSKDRNILMVQLDGMTNPVFFRTYAATDYSLKMLRLLLKERTTIELEIPAEPYGYGPKVTLSTRTMYNSMYAGPQAVINGDFETNVTGWEIETGSSTFIRHTSSAHSGTCSLEVDPNGTSSVVRVRLNANVTASVGQQWRARGWIMIPFSSRQCSLDIGFFNGSSLIGSWTSNSFTVASGTWNHFNVSATAPVNTTGVRLAASMSSTPNTNDFMRIDDLKLHQHHVDGSMYTDMSGILGDTDTPMFLKLADNFSTSGTGRRMSLLSMRKGGTPDNVPFVIESETLSRFTDTTWLLDNLATGLVATNGSYIATTFATNANLVKRMSTTWPTAWSTDLRGRYDVYIRVRGSSGNVYKFQLGWGNSATSLYKANVVTVPTTPTSVWFYMYAGTITFPAGYDPVTEGYSGVPIDAAQLYIELAIQRVSGSGGFDVDSFNFFPADDEQCLVQWPPQTNCTNYVIDGRATAVYGLDASGRAAAIDAIAVAGAVPMLRPGVTNRLFFARDVGYGTGSTQALGSEGDDPNGETTITPFYWPRYWMIRQATT